MHSIVNYFKRFQCNTLVTNENRAESNNINKIVILVVGPMHTRRSITAVHLNDNASFDIIVGRYVGLHITQLTAY